MSLVVSYRQEIYKGKEMDYKRISTGFVPICKNCGHHLGVICDSEEEAQKYVMNNPYCQGCLGHDKNVILAIKRMTTEQERQELARREKYYNRLEPKAECFLKKIHEASDIYHTRQEIACFAGYSSFAMIQQRLTRYGYKKMSEIAFDNGTVRLVYSCELFPYEHGYKDVDVITFTLDGYRGISGGVKRRIKFEQYREVTKYIIENGFKAALKHYGYSKSSYCELYKILECCGYKHWIPGPHRRGFFYNGKSMIFMGDTGKERLIKEFERWKKLTGVTE